MLTESHTNPPRKDAQTDSGKSSWTIREFADMFGVTPRTVRFYEDKGLLSPERTGQSRTFHRRDHARFERILRGKRLGFSLDDIRAVFDVLEGRISDAKELRRRRDNFQAVIDGLADRRRDVALLERDMTEIVSVIDDYLTQNSDDQTQDVSNLADRYQAAFKKHLIAQQGSI
ncbi:MerR family transcriptional regulator [Algimonas porphyrae]|uniref:MerR family transcriptional regulator n=1 Tax=Algimonas porphyrae TaxID=1128113 RepID=UPI00352B36D3